MDEVKSTIYNSITQFPFQILDHLVRDEYIDKELYIDFKGVFDHFEVEVPYYFNNLNIQTGDVIRKKNAFGYLSYNNLEGFINEQKWSMLFSSPNIVWDASLIRKYADKLNWTKPNSDNSIACLSQASNVHWSEGLVSEFLERIDLELLAKNKAITWSDEMLSLIFSRTASARHVQAHNTWHWISLLAELTPELISKFEAQLSFYSLSRNTSIHWTISLIDRYIDKWDWQGLSGNPSLPWSLGFLLRYENRLVWKWSHALPSSKGSSISTNTGITWTVKEVLTFCDRLDFFEIAKFGRIDENVLFRFYDKFNSLRLTGSKQERISDWYDSYKIYNTGWSVLAENPNFEFSFELIEFLSELEAPVIYYSGNARAGFTEHQKVVKAITLIGDCRIKETAISSLLRSGLYVSFINQDRVRRTKETGKPNTVTVLPYINPSIWNYLRKYFDHFINLHRFLRDLAARI